VEPGPLLLRPLIGLLYQPWLIDGEDCGAINGVNEWQEKPVPFCPPQIPPMTSPELEPGP
jgi:hypothetical protein